MAATSVNGPQTMACRLTIYNKQFNQPIICHINPPSALVFVLEEGICNLKISTVVQQFTKVFIVIMDIDHGQN